jgi:hypothetical protein
MRYAPDGRRAFIENASEVEKQSHGGKNDVQNLHGQTGKTTDGPLQQVHSERENTERGISFL